MDKYSKQIRNVLTIIAVIGTIIYVFSSDKCIGRTDEDIERASKNAEKDLVNKK